MDSRKEEEIKPKVEDIFGEKLINPERTKEQPRSVEVEKTIEKSPERETDREGLKEKTEQPKEKPGRTVRTQPKTIAQASIKTETYQEVEKILEAGLQEIFIQMDETERQRFKLAGEEAAGKITTLLQETKVKVKKILMVIKNWLAFIPGVNKYFLEQEAKIKTDKIMAIKQRKL